MLKILLTRIPAGTFEMGSTTGERDPLSGLIKAQWWSESLFSESPQHRVLITKRFDCAVYPITVEQFRCFISDTGYRTDAEREKTGSYRWNDQLLRWELSPSCTWQNPGVFQDDQHPVLCVSWNDAAVFCAWLSRNVQRTFRLPTEAEWEYACRSGTLTAFSVGNVLSSFQANFDGNYPLGYHEPGPYLRGTSQVGLYSPNAFGLYDMHGNVYEWCSDWFDATYYAFSPKVDPVGPDIGVERCVRGGAWNTIAARCRSACRKGGWPNFRINRRGFRVVADVD